MCRQAHHLFQEVGHDKQPSNGIINDEYRINVTQFRTTIHRYCRKIKYCLFESKSRNFKTTFISQTTSIYVNFVKKKSDVTCKQAHHLFSSVSRKTPFERISKRGLQNKFDLIQDCNAQICSEKNRLGLCVFCRIYTDGSPNINSDHAKLGPIQHGRT